jgi:hypothetical protein
VYAGHHWQLQALARKRKAAEENKEMMTLMPTDQLGLPLQKIIRYAHLGQNPTWRTKNGEGSI